MSRNRKIALGILTVLIFCCFVIVISTYNKIQHKIIYLTFDMDMDNFMYEKYLATKIKWYDPAFFSYLEQHNIPATFFVSGLFVEAYPALIKQLAAYSIFSFQNHAYNESSFVPDCYNLTTLTNDQQKIHQIEMTQQIIEKATGQQPVYFRFPGTCHSAENDALVRQLGLTVDDGTIISGDAFSTNTPAIVNTVITQARNGAVVLMHIGGHNAPESLSALEQIVPQLETNGYSFLKR